MRKIFENVAAKVSNWVNGDEYTRTLVRLDNAREEAVRRGEDPDKSPFCQKLEMQATRMERQRGLYHHN